MTDRRRLDFSNEIYSMSPVRELCVNSSESRRSSAVIASARPRRLYGRVAEHEKRAAVGRPVGSHLDGTVSIEQAYRVIASDKRQQTEGPLTNGRSATLDAARLLSRLSRALPSVPSAQFHALFRIPERARLPIRGTFGYKRGHPRVVNESVSVGIPRPAGMQFVLCATPVQFLSPGRRDEAPRRRRSNARALSP